MSRGGAAFSVVIPLFNKASFVREAVDSALAQDGPLLEVVVVDDGSTDGGAQLLEGLDRRVRVIAQSNAGVAAARNRGILEAAGDFIAFLDADDRFLPGHLLRLHELAREFPTAAVLSSGYRCFWPDGRPEQLRALPLPRGSGVVDDFYAAWLRSGFTYTSAIAVSRDALRTFENPFPVGERFGEDQDLWFRLAESWPMAHVCEAGAQYRMEVSGSATAQDVLHELLPCYLRLAERVESGQTPLRLQHSARQLVATHYLNVARQCMRRGRVGRARQLIAHPRTAARPVLRMRIAAMALAAGWRGNSVEAKP